MAQIKKQKKSRSFAAHVFGLLPSRTRHRLVQRSVRSTTTGTTVHFPPDFTTVKNVLIIMPEDAIEGFHQTHNVMSLITLFKGAAVTFFCERHASGFFRNMADVASVIEYDREDRYLFSRVFREYGRTLAESRFDVCILLEKKPDLSLLQLVARTAAKYRIGYHIAGAGAFLNLQVRVSAQQRYLTESNSALARAIGAVMPKAVRWVVSAEASSEVTQLLRDLRVPANVALAGIDAFVFHDLFGREWTAHLIKALMAQTGMAWYCIADRESSPETAQWLEQQGLRVIPVSAVSRQAALVALSSVAVCGNSLLFQIAQLLQKPAMAVLERRVTELFFRAAPALHVVEYDDRADQQTISAVIELAGAVRPIVSGISSASQTRRMAI